MAVIQSTKDLHPYKTYKYLHEVLKMQRNNKYFDYFAANNCIISEHWTSTTPLTNQPKYIKCSEVLQCVYIMLRLIKTPGLSLLTHQTHGVVSHNEI